jgi:hypothetical protein
MYRESDSAVRGATVPVAWTIPIVQAWHAYVWRDGASRLDNSDCPGLARIRL